MKSIVSIVNTGEETTVGGVLFPPLTPVTVYRNCNLLDDPATAGLVITYLSEGRFLAYSFNGNQDTPDEAIETFNYLMNEYERAQTISSYSFAYNWNKSSCVDILDGFQKQLNQFDFSGPDVTVSRVEVIRKSDYVISCLSAGYLFDAKEEMNTVTPDSDNDFLSAARMAQFVALFESALVVE